MERISGRRSAGCPHLDDALRARLRELNVTTAEEVVALAAVRGGAGGMARFLDIPEEELTARVDAIRDSLSARSVAAMEQPYATPLGLGALRPPATARSAAPGPFERAQTAALPAAVNMIARLRPVQNQGQRGTCVSFACTALNEDFEGRWLTEPGGAPDLSEQCLYRRCKEHDGEPQAEGTRVAVGMSCLVRYGQATEACEAYNPNPPTNQPGPHGARCAVESPQHKLSGLLRLHERSVPDIKGALADDRLVAFSIPVYASWYESRPWPRPAASPCRCPASSPRAGTRCCSWATRTTRPRPAAATSCSATAGARPGRRTAPTRPATARCPTSTWPTTAGRPTPTRIPATAAPRRPSAPAL